MLNIGNEGRTLGHISQNDMWKFLGFSVVKNVLKW